MTEVSLLPSMREVWVNLLGELEDLPLLVKEELTDLLQSEPVRGRRLLEF